MGFIETTKVGTTLVGADALGQLLRREDPSRFHDLPFAMHPLAFNGIEPGIEPGKSQGLCLGKRKGSIRTPTPVRWTCRLCSRIQLRTCLLIGQEALSQINSQCRVPRSALFSPVQPTAEYTRPETAW